MLVKKSKKKENREKDIDYKLQRTITIYLKKYIICINWVSCKKGRVIITNMSSDKLYNLHNVKHHLLLLGKEKRRISSNRKVFMQIHFLSVVTTH